MPGPASTPLLSNPHAGTRPGVPLERRDTHQARASGIARSRRAFQSRPSTTSPALSAMCYLTRIHETVSRGKSSVAIGSPCRFMSGSNVVPADPATYSWWRRSRNGVLGAVDADIRRRRVDHQGRQALNGEALLLVELNYGVAQEQFGQNRAEWLRAKGALVSVQRIEDRTDGLVRVDGDPPLDRDVPLGGKPRQRFRWPTRMPTTGRQREDVVGCPHDGRLEANAA
jgi:hypothetical protein